LNPELSKAYEVLGVKPGVSMKELKAAHRDLAKVWHPDRFQHDPRLQQKAQEKLKEINEAYDQISSGKVPKPANPSRQETQKVHHPKSRGINWQWAALPLLIFAAVFALTTRALLRPQRQPLPEEPQVEESANVNQEQQGRPDANTRAEVRNASRKSNSADDATPAPEVITPVSIPTAPALATVTVTIDPDTGLLAKPECPVKTRMTYPSGSQPAAYCTLSHAPPPKDSRIKSIAKTVKRTLD
jgi:hypothetical protein